MSEFIPKPDDLASQFDAVTSTHPEAESVYEREARPEVEEQPRSKTRKSRRRQRLRPWLVLRRLRNAVSPPIKGIKNAIWRQPGWYLGLGLGISSGAVLVGWGWYLLLAMERELPDATTEVLRYVPTGTVTIKASDGTIIQQTGPASRETLKIWEFPEPLIHAFVAIEDQRFQSHEGIDYQGIFRAALANVVAGEVVEGGSTLTQQLARIVYLDRGRNLERKLKETLIAQRLERDLNKEQILERYLNLVYLGSGAYGVADAAWVYFSKTVDELTLPEMAMLAGLPPAPSVYSPFINGNAAKERRNLVLRRMLKGGYITQEEAQRAIAAPIRTNPSEPKRLEREAYYFTEYIQQELPKYVSKEVMAVKGLTVETTLNPEWQTAAEEAVKETIERFGRYQRFEQAALVAVDPRNGRIRAMVGGKDFYDFDSNNYLNRVTQAQRQPGSTFKTFVYTTGVAAGISPYRGYSDTPFIVDGYEPKNYGETFRGWTTIRDALTYSVNVVAVKALLDIGWDPVIEIAQKMGIKSKLHPTYSLALGASEVNLLELTSAYGTLATQGVHVDPHGIDRILDQRGNVIYEAQVNSKRAIDEETSAITTWMLQNVMTSGTGRAAQIGRPVAGKTGTSDEARDLWFIGYIPQLVAGVWLGNDDNRPTWGASTTAAITWDRFMEKVVEDMKVEEFPPLPRLDGREGIIETEPIKPKRIQDKPIPSSSQQTSSSRRRTRQVAANYSRSSRRRSYRRSQGSTRTSQPRSTRSYRNSSPPRNTAPAAPPPAPKPAAPAPSTEQKLEFIPAAAPPAPPASRKVPAAPAPAAPAAPAPAAPAPAVETAAPATE